MAYMGFKKLKSKLESEGKSPKAAGAIAASVGRKKYGAKKFNKAAAAPRASRTRWTTPSRTLAIRKAST